MCHWVQVDNGNPDKVTTQGKTIQTYAYKIDGSEGNPKPVNPRGLISYCCADVFLTYDPIPANGGKYGSYYYFNPATGERTYLTEHPGEPGYFDKEEGYYFIDGDTQEEEILVETGLEGSYILVCTPDCLILASRGVTSSHDDTLYFYNWDFQLVDTVVVSYPHEVGLEHLIYGETVDKILLSTSSSGMPKYYIDKAELGTENAGVHTINFEN